MSSSADLPTDPPSDLPADWIRPLGSTGLNVSAVCFGGGPIGNLPPDADGDVTAMIGDLLASPIRFLDTSNGYGAGESERRIGAGIAAFGGLPDDVLVATKVDAKGGDYSGSRVRASVAESADRLGIGTLPMVYLHDPEFHDFAFMSGPGGAVEALVALKEEGVIGHIGLAAGDVHEMAKYLDLGVFEVVLNHCRWTLVDRSSTELLAQAESMGVAFVNAAVYGGGILARPDESTSYGYRPATPETLEAIHALDALAKRHGTSLASLAVAASVRDARVTSTVVGFTKPSRIQPLIDAATADVPEQLWAEAAELLPAAENWLDYPF